MPRHQEEVAELVRRLLDGESLDADEMERLLTAVGISEAELRSALLLDVDEAADAEDVAAELPDPDEPTILFTSLLDPKGLSAAHVFVVDRPVQRVGRFDSF